MKILGMVGGLGPESTVDYYRRLIDTYRARRSDGTAPSILINSIDMNRLVDLVIEGNLPGMVDYLAAEITRLASGGAMFAIVSANTPHIVFDDLRRRSPIPLISIVEATRDEAVRLGLRRVALFGTRFTMEGSFYPGVFAGGSVHLVVPNPDERSFIHDKYMKELVNGAFLTETHAAFLRLVDTLKARESIDGVILGGTELPLLITDVEHNGVKFLNTTQIHVNAAVCALLS
jgi:aspartate racemase